VTALAAPHWADLVKVRLGYGRDRARTIGSLQETLGVSRRIIEKAIEQLRLEGCEVCTGPDGAYLSLDSAELYQHAQALRSRAIHILLGARALRATARRHERAQQTTLPWQEVA
jgi:hypothetical protein